MTARLYSTGFSLGKTALDDMLTTKHQGEAMQALRSALAQLPRGNAAAVGFVDALAGDINECHTPEKGIRLVAEDDLFCPLCHKETVILNMEREHFAVCHHDKIWFHVGSNLHSGWRTESPDVWAANSKLLADYVELAAGPAHPDDRNLPF